MAVVDLNQTFVDSTSGDGCKDLNQIVIDSLIVMAVWI